MEKIGKIIRETLVRNIKAKVQDNTTTIVLSYSAVSSARMGILRKDLKKMGAQVHVSKNRIAQIALKELKQEKIAEDIHGQTAFVWTNADPVSVSKALVSFTKECESAKIQGGLLSGSYLAKDDVKRLSDLPSREVLLSRVLGVMIAPVQRLMGAMNAKSRDLLSILKQYSEKKGGS